MGVQIEPVNREKYLALLADIYQYDAGNMLYRPDAELDQMVRSDAVKYSVFSLKRKGATALLLF